LTQINFAQNASSAVSSQFGWQNANNSRQAKTPNLPIA
jgi:hypothetical protein